MNQTLDFMRKALFDFTQDYFHQYHDEFLSGAYLKYLNQPTITGSDVVFAFAQWCESCGYWEV